MTDLLQPGRNAIGVILGDGWFRGRLGFGGGQRNIWGDRLALLAQLEIQYADGSSACIATDDQWRAATGAILMNSLYDDETYDARLEPLGWSAPGFDDAAWRAVRPLAWDMSTLVAPVGPPVRRTERILPVAITQSPSGQRLLDFGQNLVGRLAITVQGQAGQTITLRHAEVLEHGELGVRPLRLAEAGGSHRSLHPARRRRRKLGAALHLSRLPPSPEPTLPTRPPWSPALRRCSGAQMSRHALPPWRRKHTPRLCANMSPPPGA